MQDVHAETRESLIAASAITTSIVHRLCNDPFSLADFEFIVHGVVTNIDFMQARHCVLKHEDFPARLVKQWSASKN
jgi:hypothetical protein